MLENRDYVFVSEKIWKYLKIIYGGYPELRRTGTDFIELYPKILKIYTSLYNEELSFESEKIREASSYLTLEDVLFRLNFT